MNSKVSKYALSLALLAGTFSPEAYARSVAYRPNGLPKELISFSNCEAMQNHVDQLLKSHRNEFSQNALRKSRMIPMPMTEQIAAAPAAKGQAAERASEIADFAAEVTKPDTVVGTNNQVEKVDEADFVKFNGKNIFQLYNGSLKILKAWPANELNQIASLDIAGHPQEMLVNEKNAVIMASVGQHLAITIVDISNPSRPRELTRFEIPGMYRTARLIGDTLRIVNRDYGSMHTYWHPRPTTHNSWLQEDTSLQKLNLQPTTQVFGNIRKEIDVIKNCANVLVPKDVAPSVLTRIISIDLQAKDYQETLAFVDPQNVYASEQAIYLAQSGWGYQNGYSHNQTSIHKFSLNRGSTARYLASGTVNGNLINQFAMDEHNGYLRVATNGGAEYVGAGLWGGNDQQWKTINRVQVLQQKGKKLDTIGKTKDMAEGERLYSVRFDGDKGYVVTFRQVDPLFTIDLKNPRNPKVVGELKVPGFSTYIHMLDDKHLLTVGQDADENNGRTRGLKLSVFDVSNFAKPREVKSLIFNQNVTSESSYEHKAFSFYRQKGILAIPASEMGRRSSLLLFKVTTSDIKPAGELEMTDMFSAISYGDTVRRAFFADNIVYAIAASGVKAADLNNSQNPLATVHFDKHMADVTW